MTLNLPNLIALGNAARKPPWTVDEDPRVDGADQILDTDDLTICFMSTPAEESKADSAFICALVNAFPAIIAELEECERLRGELEKSTVRQGEIAWRIIRIQELEKELATLRQRLDPPARVENEEGM